MHIQGLHHYRELSPIEFERNITDNPLQICLHDIGEAIAAQPSVR